MKRPDRRVLALATTVVIAAVLPAQAQNTQDGLWRGSLSLGGSYGAGNTDAWSLSFKADAKRATAVDGITLGATALGGETTTDAETTRTAELVKLGGRYDYNLTADVFSYGSVEVEHDQLQELDLRASLGAGLGYRILATRDSEFDVFGGLGATHEAFTAETRDFAEAVLGEESSHRLSESTTFKQRFVIQPNLEDSGEFRATFDATLATAITAGWTLNLTLTDRYLSNPQPGLKPRDTLILIGIGSKFGPT